MCRELHPVILLQIPDCTASPNFTTTFSIEIDIANCSLNRTRPDPVTLDVNCGTNAQTLMEQAVDVDSAYYFTASYYGSQVGYDVIAISGIENEGDCEWHLYYQAPDEDEAEFTMFNVTQFIIPCNGSNVIMRYDYEPVDEPIVSPTPTPTPMMEDDSASPLGQYNVIFVMVSILFALVLFS